MISDNLAHRALFTLPPIRPSAETAPAVQAMPTQKTVTGDKELDAVLWLREVISTGKAGLIAVALDAAKKITSPAKTLEMRYARYLQQETGNPVVAALGSIGFANMEDLAMRSLEKAVMATEARARFDGETIWQDTPAERFCAKALNRCKGFRSYIDCDKEAAHKRFRKRADLMPHTLDDCLHELAYWQQLYGLRSAVGDHGDGQHESIIREWFVEGLLAEIKPRSRDEAIRALDYASYAEGIEHDGLVQICRNLLDHPGDKSDPSEGASRVVQRAGGEQ